MKIETVRVRNFRSLRDATLTCDNLTVLVGRNGSGKSSFLRALELFYSKSPSAVVDDFYNRDTSAAIAIAVTFGNLSEAALDRFKPYVRDAKLNIERLIQWDGTRPTSSLHGFAMRNPKFAAVRNGLLERDRGKTAKEALDALRKQPEYASLPAWTKIADVEPALAAWEAENPDRCEQARDDGKFFGFQSVGQGYLSDFTQFLYIPAVRDAATDAQEGRNSVFTELMDLVVRSALAERDEIRKFRDDFQSQYMAVMDPSKLGELQGLSQTLTATLTQYAPGSSVELDWEPLGSLDVPLPKARPILIEDDYPCEVERVGHGLQRAYIITMLQHLAAAQSRQSAPLDSDAEADGEGNGSAGEAAATALPHLMLAIEEPELYQHPSRQRHFARVLRNLAEGAILGVAEDTQVVYGTHSPLFVQLDRFHQVRVLRKFKEEDDLPPSSAVVAPNGEQILGAVCDAEGKDAEGFTLDGFLARLQTSMTPWMNEGFFADVVVLVEGEDDLATLLGAATANGYQIDGHGIVIVPCRGKTNIHGPAIVFKHFGIPVYVVWDGDKSQKGAKPEDNHRLLRMLAQSCVDWPSSVEAEWACFEDNLESTLANEFGQHHFDEAEIAAREKFGFRKKKHAIKCPQVVAEILQSCRNAGQESPTISKIVDSILAMHAATK